MRAADPLKIIDPAEALAFLRGDGLLRRLALGLVEKLLAVDRVNELLLSVDPAAWEESVLAKSQVTIEIEGTVPASGAQIWACNHPMGGIDALSAMVAARRDRSDVLTLANQIVARIPWLDGQLLNVDILDPAEKHGNRAAMRTAVRHLRQGGRLVVFPAGQVAHRSFPGDPEQEAPWTPHLATLSRLGHAPVLPVGIPGTNPRWFHVFGRIHPLVRTALLPRAFLAMRGIELPLRLGPPIAPPSSREEEPVLVETARRLSLRLANRPVDDQERTRPVPSSASSCSATSGDPASWPPTESA